MFFPAKNFETDRGNYIYSTFLNKIYKVSKKTHELIQNYVESIHSPSIGCQKGCKIRAPGIINDLKKELYLSVRPKRVLSFKSDDIIKNLNSSLEHLILETTEDCNLRCAYCVNSGMFRFHRTYSKKSMALATAIAAVDFFVPRSGAELHPPVIGFYGGEPLINFNLIERIISYVKHNYKDNSITFTVTTNGTLITRDIAKYFIKNNVRLSISLDGPEEIHDRYRVFPDGSGSFNIIIQNLKMINAIDKAYYRRNVYFQPLFCPPFNYKRVINFFMNNDLFTPKTIFITNYVKLDDSSVSLDCYGEEEQLSDDIYLGKLKRSYLLEGGSTKQADNFLRQLFTKELVKFHARPQGFCNHFYKYIQVPAICIPGKRRLFVDSDGFFHICERIEHSYPIGHVNEGFFLNKIKTLLNDYCSLSAQDCCNCWAFRLCGICFVNFLKGGKLDSDYRKTVCEKERKRILANLIIYMSIIEKNPRYFKNYSYVD